MPLPRTDSAIRPAIVALASVALATLAALALTPRAGLAQNALDQTPNLAGPWVGLPGMVELDVLQRYGGQPGEGIGSLPTAFLGLGLRPPVLLGAALAVRSPVVTGEPDELELFGRYRPVEQARGAPVDAGVQLGFNTAAESVDGEISAAGAARGVRALAALRVFSNGYDTDGFRAALAGGVVWYPLPGRVPVALAGDVASLLNRERDLETWVWGVGIQVGLSFIANTLSIQATNATSGTLEGRSLGTDDFRLGFELTVPIPTAAQLLGYYVKREVAVKAVQPVPPPPAGAKTRRGGGRIVTIDIRDYEFLSARTEVPAGTVVVWVNRDEVVHTATADDVAWNSDAIPPGGRWSATFGEPGVYPYHCGPHPFMRGVVIVR